MVLIKKITASPLWQRIFAFIIAKYIKFVFLTSNLTYTGFDRLDCLALSKKPMIIAFWHGRLAMLPCAWMWKKPLYMMLSKHRDGLFISRVLSHFQIQSIYGSSTRGGISAGVNVLSKMKEGAVIGITPDGPRGPTQKCSKGIITLAHMASQSLGPVTLVPVSYATSNHLLLKSWDRFMVPFPFSKLHIIIGDFISIDKNDPSEMLESHRIYLEHELNQAQEKGK